MTLEVRMIQESDAGPFLTLNSKLDNETKFMMLEPDERNVDAEFEKQQIETLLASGNSTIFVVEDRNELVGYIALFGGRYRRIRHCAHIVIGILAEYRGKKLGTILFQIAEKWAADVELTRLELTVISDNKAALALYKKMGFEIEGLKKNSLFIDGKYVDEYYMGKAI